MCQQYIRCNRCCKYDQQDKLFQTLQQVPETASTYRGRILMKQEILSKQEAPDKEEVTQGQPWKKRIKQKSWPIHRTDYVLSCVIYPEPNCHNPRQVSLPKERCKLKFRAEDMFFTVKKVENTNGVSRWEELMDNRDEQMNYPTILTRFLTYLFTSAKADQSSIAKSSYRCHFCGSRRQTYWQKNSI